MSDEPIIIITQGEKAEFDIFLEKAEGYPRPIDLTDYDKFSLCLPKNDDTHFSITETVNANGSKIEKVTPDILGQLHVTLGVEDTKLLKEGYGQDMGLTWDIAATPAPKRKILIKSLNVDGYSCN